MRVAKELVIEPAQSWARLQQLKNSEWFIHDVEEQLKENHRLFLEELMRYERQEHLGVAPYERAAKRADQANGFYQRTLLTRLGPMQLAVPRSRSGLFQTQILRRYQRREAAVDEALRKVFLLGVSTRQAGPALATLLDEAVSAATVSALSKVLDQTVAGWHRRLLTDTYRYLIFDGVSVRIRLVGKSAAARCPLRLRHRRGWPARVNRFPFGSKLRAKKTGAACLKNCGGAGCTARN